MGRIGTTSTIVFVVPPIIYALLGLAVRIGAGRELRPSSSAMRGFEPVYADDLPARA
jgi:hypothetical protein